MRDEVKYEDGVLSIHYPNYGDEGRNYGELFDFLGDFDIITASEIGKDVIVMSAEVFLFSNSDEWKLKRDSKIEIERHSSLEEFINKKNKDHINFLDWYYN